MNEFIGYPYIPGVCGIPLDELKPTEESKPVRSASNKRLTYFLTSCHVGVFDTRAGCWLISTLDDSRRVMFDVKSYYSVSETETRRHPDFFGGEFIKWCFWHFERQGLTVDSCQDYWLPYSINYKQFMAAYKETGDKTQAALSTWAARTLAKNGLTRIDDQDIFINNGPKFPTPHISLVYHREVTSNNQANLQPQS